MVKNEIDTSGTIHTTTRGKMRFHIFRCTLLLLDLAVVIKLTDYILVSCAA